MSRVPRRPLVPPSPRPGPLDPVLAALRTAARIPRLARVATRALAVLLSLSLAPDAVRAQAPDDAAGPAPVAAPSSWLVLPAVDARGRRPLRPDAVFAAHLLDRFATPPEAGDTVTGELGEEQAWELRASDENDSPGGGIAWAYGVVESDRDQVVMARLTGASSLFVNGDGFAGDVYAYGWPGVPVLLTKGENALFVTGIRGAFQLSFSEPPAELVAGSWDHTRPDLVVGAHSAGPVGLLVLNAVDAWVPELETTTLKRERLRGVTSVDHAGLVPLGVRKLRLDLVAREGQQVGETETSADLAVRVESPSAGVAAEDTLTLRVVPAGARQRHTFVSGIDGSVQFFSVLPPAPSDARAGALLLTLHGAGADAHAQAGSYVAKPGLWVVAPTNRRVFGFDWQDWGRQDAYEVLERALVLTGAERERVSVTGHSMGGHGAWHLAANDPDAFAVVAPSAGWRSFDTYGGRPEGALAELWHHADGPSRTDLLMDNLAQRPVFILHGTQDESVPLAEAEAMLTSLRDEGADPRFHFEDGAGHWWGRDDVPGVACVDWPELTPLFLREQVPIRPEVVRFTTMSPAVDSQHYWVRVEQVLDPYRHARVEALNGDEVVVATHNVRRLVLTVPSGSAEPGTPVPLDLDGEALQTRAGVPTAFLRGGDGWRPAPPLDLDEKRPDRSGPFKRAFDRDFVLVVGTAGETEESQELLARARHDAQVWWYRANGDAPILTDREFLERAPDDRNVILYGNADTNAAWAALLDDDCPLSARRGRIALGDESWSGPDIAAVFVYPKRGSNEALVGVFTDSGVAGTRLGYTLAPFVSGVGYPDYTVFSAEVLANGDEGVLSAGFFDNHWALAPAER